MAGRNVFPRSTVAVLREKLNKYVLPAIRDLGERVGEIEAMLEEMQNTPRKDTSPTEVPLGQ